MLMKSALRETIVKVLADHEMDDGELVDDLVDRISVDLGEVQDDDELGADEELE